MLELTHLMSGGTRELLPSTLHELGPVDAFFHDSDHTYETMMIEYSEAFMHLKSGGLIVSDDAIWNTEFLDFSGTQDLTVRFNYHRGVSASFTLIRKS